MKNNVDNKVFGLDKDAHAVLDGELVLLNEFGGKHEYESDKSAPATPQAVFELFNAVVSAVEAEANARGRYDLEQYGKLSYAEKRNLELVDGYDEFINAPDFELDVFTVRILQMEEFWSNVYSNNNVGVANKAVTYGKSTIYPITRGKHVVGYLLNNMTYDGQNSYCLTSKKYGGAARRCFTYGNNYPAVKHVNGQPRNRWTRVLDELTENGGNTVNAWSILETEDSKFFYAELKKHNGVDKAMRQQLKAVERVAGGRTFTNYVEALELHIDVMEQAREELEDKLSDNGANWTESKRNALENGLRRLDTRIYEKNVELWDLTEEHNSESAVTTMEDY